jgi:hypothetical protein
LTAEAIANGAQKNRSRETRFRRRKDHRGAIPGTRAVP